MTNCPALRAWAMRGVPGFARLGDARSLDDEFLDAFG